MSFCQLHDSCVCTISVIIYCRYVTFYIFTSLLPILGEITWVRYKLLVKVKHVADITWCTRRGLSRCNWWLTLLTGFSLPECLSWSAAYGLKIHIRPRMHDTCPAYWTLCVCVCIPILVTMFPEWLRGTEPLLHTPGAVRPSSLCL